MRCLLVTPPFARWIVQGVKTIEYRRQWTYIRGRVGIMQTGSVGNDRKLRAILGDVDIIACALNKKLELYEWILLNPRMYVEPVLVPIECGPQIFLNVDYDVPSCYARPVLDLDTFQTERIAYNEAIGKYLQNLRAKAPIKTRRICNA